MSDEVVVHPTTDELKAIAASAKNVRTDGMAESLATIAENTAPAGE